MFFDFISDFYLSLVETVMGLESIQQILMLAVAGAIPFVESYLGSFLGILVGVSPAIAVPAAVVGNLVSTGAVTLLAHRARTAVVARRATVGANAAVPGSQASGVALAERPDASERIDDAESTRLTGARRKVAEYMERVGVPGVCLAGPMVVASQITAPTLVGLGASKRTVTMWTAVSIVGWGVAFGFFTEAVMRIFG